MNINIKMFATALLMSNVCIYVLHIENGLTMHKTIFMHVFFSLVTLLFHYITTGLEAKNEEDESTGN